MYVHRSQRLIYLAHPRTASHATMQALEVIGFEKALRPDGRHAHHAQLYDPGSPVTLGLRRTWSIATTVRDHYDAAVSWVCWDTARFVIGQPKKPPIDVEEHHLERAFHHARAYVRNGKMYGLHLPAADVVLRYEHLAEDLRAWCGADLEHRVNASDRQDVSLTDEARQYIATRFADEIALLGY